MSNNLGIDMIVNPEYEAAREAARLIRFPVAIKLEKFAQGQVEMVEIHIGKGHPFCDLPIIDFKSKFDTNALICMAERGDEVIIPGGDYVIREGDSIFITASRKDITDLFVRIGLIGKQIKDVLLIGGERISRYLAPALLNDGYKVKIIEQNSDICEELAELFPKATVICGNPSDPDVLEDEGIDGTGACVVMTNNDQANLLISMFASTKKVEKIISKTISSTFAKLSDSAGVDSNITPHLLSSAKVLRYIRGLANKGEKGYKSEIRTLYKLANGRLEAIEFDVADDFEYTGVALRDLNPKLKKNILIGAIIRESVVIYPHGNTTLEVGDRVVVITKNASLCDLDDIIA
jgi:trk system potassium uptake protein TrkA